MERTKLIERLYVLSRLLAYHQGFLEGLEGMGRLSEMAVAQTQEVIDELDDLIEDLYEEEKQ